MGGLVCAVDVGTGSARAGILGRSGRLLGRADHASPPRPDHAEHNSEDIWSAVCLAVRAARQRAGVAAEDVAGISSDATCSLVLLDFDGGQLTVSTGGDDRWDTIVWLDHRAEGGGRMHRHRPSRARLRRGVMSPEMQAPKMIWLKRNFAEKLSACRLHIRPDRFPDLPGFRLARPLAMHADLQMDLSGA